MTDINVEIQSGSEVTVEVTSHETVVHTEVPGRAGVGVPAGGATGQALVKTSEADYDTKWADVASGGGDGLKEYASIAEFEADAETGVGLVAADLSDLGFDPSPFRAIASTMMVEQSLYGFPIYVKQLDVAGVGVRIFTRTFRMSDGALTPLGGPWAENMMMSTVGLSSTPAVVVGQQLLPGLSAIVWEAPTSVPVASSAASLGIAKYSSDATLRTETPVTEEDAVPLKFLDLRVPEPPASGSYTLQSVDGVVTWVAT